MKVSLAKREEEGASRLPPLSVRPQELLPQGVCSLTPAQERFLLEPYGSLHVRSPERVPGRMAGGGGAPSFAPLHRPTISRNVAERHNPTTGHRSSPSFPLLQGSKRSLSPPASTRTPSASRRSPPTSAKTPFKSRRSPPTSTLSPPSNIRTPFTSNLTPPTSGRSPCTTSPVASWFGVQAGPPVEERLCSPSSSAPDEEPDSELEVGDGTEISDLLESYSSTFDAENLPVGGGTIRSEDLGELYTCFIQRRAKFLVGTPFYGILAPADRLRLLHVAVAMSTYFTGAHLIDTRDYTWRSRRGKTSSSSSSPVMSASTVRQFLSHDQFVRLMRFYTTYSPSFSDLTSAVLMQVLSLFYPQEGLQDPSAAEKGRLHYQGLLSRYLRAKYGTGEGRELLETLLRSQAEARQLVDLLQHVELTPQAPKEMKKEEEEEEGASSHQILRQSIRLVCDSARDALAKGIREREGRAPAEGLSVRNEAQPRLDLVEKILTSLADCEDPHILAEARRILPADLVRRFLQQLQCDEPPDG